MFTRRSLSVVDKCLSSRIKSSSVNCSLSFNGPNIRPLTITFREPRGK